MDDRREDVRLAGAEKTELRAEAVGLRPAHDTGEPKAGGGRKIPDDGKLGSKGRQMLRFDVESAHAEIDHDAVERWLSHTFATYLQVDFYPRMATLFVHEIPLSLQLNPVELL
jgi:hypothetical protein